MDGSRIGQPDRLVPITFHTISHLKLEYPLSSLQRIPLPLQAIHEAHQLLENNFSFDLFPIPATIAVGFLR